MTATFDLVCLSHLRWDFVFQRPQHLMGRCARSHRVFFVEEPIFDSSESRLDVSAAPGGVTVVVPHLPSKSVGDEVDEMLRELVSDLFTDYQIDDFVLWYYTPMAVLFTEQLKPLATVYDCMDELSAFHGAPKILRDRERELFKRADLIFTGGQSLYEAKRDQHPAVYAFPSSVDAAHFATAKQITVDTPDQATIPRPRIGFYGVIDERSDLELLAAIADLKPDWHWIMIGPVVKIDRDSLPTRANVHFLGGKSYVQLPEYLAGWDVAMMPFARNESTRFISPTKTPEYLAAGKPVVSTSIRDVVRPYQELGLVHIADTPEEFVAAVQTALDEDPLAREEAAGEFLAANSWDKTWDRMEHLIEDVVAESRASRKEHYNV